MKKLYFLLLLSFFLQKTNAQWVTIPDANFVTFLQQNYPACMNGNQMDTTCSEIMNAYSVDCSNKNISDLTGIQYFDNLYVLTCENNNLTVLSALPQSLKQLNCANNQLINLPALPQSLQFLSCNNNQLITLPSLPSSLILIHCYNNQLSSLPFLPPLLEIFFCQNNLLSTLPPLPPSLYSLNCSSNQLSSLPSLPSALKFFDCSYNLLSSLPTLPDTLNLLHINNNPNLKCLPQLKYLSQFQYASTGISCLPNNPILFGWIWVYPPLGTYPICSSTINAQITSSSTSLCGVSSITLSADTGSGYTYQWRLNGSNIQGATSQTYNATVTGNYTVVVSVNCTLQTSNTITITSGTAPSAAITASGSTSLCAGNTVTLNANTGVGLSYQWQLNGSNITDANASSYIASIAGNYSVIVSNNCGSSVSNIINVTVGAAPSATITASGSTSLCAGSTVTLNANTGVGLSYQWQLDGNNINGATSSSYTATTSGNYSVIVSNNCGNNISNIITVNATSAPGSAGTIAGPTSFCRHTTQTFSVTPVAGATNYVWSVPPQATITSGQGTNSIVVNFKVKQGNVTVKAANQCGAGPLSVLPVQVVKCAQANNAVMRTGLNSEMIIFPNPATSDVTIQFYSETENNFSLKLFDIHGRIILKENSKIVIGINERKLDVEFLNKGIYLVEIVFEKDKMMKKLVVN